MIWRIKQAIAWTMIAALVFGLALPMAIIAVRASWQIVMAIWAIALGLQVPETTQ
jgi:hypothetical protein